MRSFLKNPWSLECRPHICRVSAMSFIQAPAFVMRGGATGERCGNGTPWYFNILMRVCPVQLRSYIMQASY